jgi:hypothetical protein
MNGALTIPEETDRSSEEKLSGVVIYEDKTTRDRAIQLCDSLVRNLWSDLSLEFTWWKFDYLRDAEISRIAVEAATHADVVLFSAHARRQLPSAVESWIESWVQRREKRPAVLVALIGLATDQFKGLSPIHIYLRAVAERAQMDYLPHVLHTVSERADISAAAITDRAEKFTSVLDGILQHHPAPSRWGINE